MATITHPAAKTMIAIWINPFAAGTVVDMAERATKAKAACYTNAFVI